MSDDWLGELRLFTYTSRIPSGWRVCDGAVLNIKENAALFSLIGNRYGGDGKVTFALPYLRGRVPIHFNPADPACPAPGKNGGQELVALTSGQLPPHIHTLLAFNAPGQAVTPAGNTPAAVGSSSSSGAPVPPPAFAPYAAGTTQALADDSFAKTGGDGAHENRQPTIALQWCICTMGVYPTRD